MSPQLLIYTRTTGFRHDSIPFGVTAIQELGDEHGFDVLDTEDPATLEGDLERFAAVLFLSTSGDVLTHAGREALKSFVEAGGGFVGVHSAACTEYDWPYYGELLGARFAGHPAYQPGNLHIEDRTHPATQHLPPVWAFTDEWYNFRANPREAVHVLACADEESYEGGEMGDDHPMAWCRQQGAGRVFYTALGHASEVYQDAAFRGHLLGGIQWASRISNSLQPAMQGNR